MPREANLHLLLSWGWLSAVGLGCLSGELSAVFCSALVLSLVWALVELGPILCSAPAWSLG